MTEIKIDYDIEVYCYECGYKMYSNFSNKGRLEVSPCEECKRP